VEIPHGRVKSRFSDNASDFQIYIGFPDLFKPEFPHGRVEIPHGRVEARFIVYLRPILGFQRGLLGGGSSGLCPNFEGAAARVSERLLEALEDRHHAYEGGFYDALC